LYARRVRLWSGIGTNYEVLLVTSTR